MAKAGDGLKTLTELLDRLTALHYQLLSSHSGADNKIVDGRQLRIEDYGFLVPILVLQEGQSARDAMPEVARRAQWDADVVRAIKVVNAAVQDLQKSTTVRRGDVGEL